MDKAKRDLIRNVFNGGSRLSYNDLMAAHSLRGEVSRMSPLKKAWIVGFASIYTDVDNSAYDKKLSKAMLKSSKKEYEALVEHGKSASLDEVLESEKQITTLLAKGGYNMGSLSLFGVMGSPERKINNIVRDAAIREADVQISAIDSKLQQGQPVKDEMAALEKATKTALSRRSMWDKEVSKLCDRAVEAQLKVVENVLSRNPSISNIDKTAHMLERLEKTDVAKYASRAERKEITKTLHAVKDKAIDGIKAELQKANPNPAAIKEYAKVIKDHRSLRKQLDGSDKDVLSNAKDTVKQIEAANKKQQQQGQPSTLMSMIGDIVSSFRGQQIAVGRP